MTPVTWISTVVLVLFGMATAMMFLWPVPSGAETILNVLLGTLGAMAVQVVGYWVGSSSGSARKTELLKDIRETLQ